jgi:hypothetical protein
VAIAVILHWWNEKLVPILTELEAKSARMPLQVAKQISLEEGVFSGPKDYMDEQGNALLDRIVAGQDTVFNLAKDQSPDIETAILVRLQTDYAGWLGLKQAEGYILNVSKDG